MIIKKFLKGVDSVTNFWISFTLAVMLVVILLDIVLREVFGSPLTWHLEMSQYCLINVAYIGALINVAYIGAAVAHRHRNHISINLFTSMLPPKKEGYVNLIGKAIILPFIFILAYSSFEILLKTKGVTPSLRLPKWTYYFPIFVGSVCLCIYSVSMLIQDFLKIRNGVSTNSDSGA
ncbi:MAG: TRAP transporter small permease [Deltaproteobacteria bacterium]|nr:TRAP transporter small permease [Deltaproteobacteria bacterium]